MRLEFHDQLTPEGKKASPVSRIKSQKNGTPSFGECRDVLSKSPSYTISYRNTQILQGSSLHYMRPGCCSTHQGGRSYFDRWILEHKCVSPNTFCMSFSSETKPMIQTPEQHLKNWSWITAGTQLLGLLMHPVNWTHCETIPILQQPLKTKTDQAETS